MSSDETAPVTVSSIHAMLASAGVDGALVGSGSTVVEHITHDSRQVRTGTLFACLTGQHVDGHSFAGRAVAAGATALLVERPLTSDGLGDVPQIVVDEARRCLGPISAFVLGYPARDLTVVGVTGTNGKTTTCAMLHAIFEANQWSTGIIGTLHGPRTTPEAPELQSTLASFVEKRCRAAVLEVSSHALALHRVDGTRFDAVVFTNLGHDHLDLHGTPEEYFRAKASLFTPEFAPIAVINADDTHGRLLLDVLADAAESMEVVAFSTADLTDVVVTATSISYRWRGHDVFVAIGGDFNVSNSLAALETATALGIDPALASAALADLSTIPGRFETVDVISGTSGTSGTSGNGPGFSVVVDYAHTPDGLTEVIGAARSVVDDDASVIVVFGCGGDRDQAKRPAMGEAAAADADRVVITSDNPRSEDPEAIINDIVAGVPEHYRGKVTRQPDRRLAIGAALHLARTGDIVVIAGKGHEQTQDIGGDVVAFDDRAVARSFLAHTESTDL